VIHHVALEVAETDAGACVAFWALLGFGEVGPPASLRPRARWVQRGDTQVHLMLAEEPVVPPTGHVAVVAEDDDGAVARLLDAGFDPEPRAEHWGSPRCFVRDPAGHRVEVMAYRP
jgi:catechol 2,3-dioxygenase-like lactoylglutathione lyase family enzyme